MKYKFWLLQLFADGISGDTGAADAGQQSAGGSPVRANMSQDAAAKPTRLTWAQIMADPEYNREMQKIVSARLKAAQADSVRRQRVTDPGGDRHTVGGHSVTKAAVESAAPGKAGSARRQSVTDPGGDRHIVGGHSVTKAAVEEGTQNNAAQTRSGKNPELSQGGSRPSPTEDSRADSRLRQHFASLVEQAENLRQVFPDFSLEQALQDPVFFRLTAPHTGVSVESAYYLQNRQKHQVAAMQVAARKTAEKLANTIRSGQFRPVENGTIAQAPTLTTFDYAHATAQQRQALKSAIRRSASRGEKIYPTELG